jgi:hypothetical protein
VRRSLRDSARRGVRLSARAIAVAALFAGSLLAGPADLESQSTSRPTDAATGAISGRVLDGPSRTPIADAIVTLNVRGDPRRQLTDARGRFVFTGVPPSTSYNLNVLKAGYLSAEFGPGAAARRPIALEAGTWIGDEELSLWRGAVITGRVFDEAFEPAVGVPVRLLSRVRVAGRVHLARGPTAKTDDRGEYRFSNLAPGQYLVAVLPSQVAVPVTSSERLNLADGDVDQLAAVDRRVFLGIPSSPVPPPFDGEIRVYPASFHGGSTVQTAASLDVGFGAERAGVDVHLMPAATVTVEGRLVGPADAMPRLLVRLVPEGLEDLAEAHAATTRPDADGRFVLVGVPAGGYTATAGWSTVEFVRTSGPNLSPSIASFTWRHPLRSGGFSQALSTLGVGPPDLALLSVRDENATTFAGSASVVVTENEAPEIVIRLESAAPISGRVVFEAAMSGVAVPTTGGVSLEPATGSPRLRSMNYVRASAPDWEFRLEGFGVGSYLPHASATPAWILKSFMIDGRDYADRPYVAGVTTVTNAIVTLTSAVPELDGTVRDATGRPVSAGIVAFPVDKAQWIDYGATPSRIKATTASDDGRYHVTSLPAGDYYVVAVPSGEVRSWQDAGFFEGAAGRATRVSLDWGDSVTRHLVLRAIR